jgi:hypothetical protein
MPRNQIAIDATLESRRAPRCLRRVPTTAAQFTSPATDDLLIINPRLLEYTDRQRDSQIEARRSTSLNSSLLDNGWHPQRIGNPI